MDVQKFKYQVPRWIFYSGYVLLSILFLCLSAKIIPAFESGVITVKTVAGYSLFLLVLFGFKRCLGGHITAWHHGKTFITINAEHVIIPPIEGELETAIPLNLITNLQQKRHSLIIETRHNKFKLNKIYLGGAKKADLFANTLQLKLAAQNNA